MPSTQPKPSDEKPVNDEDSAPPNKTITKRKPKRVYSIPRVSFRRLVQEIADSYGSDLRIQQSAIDALQESAENMLSERFVRCAELADLCKLDTIRDEHWRFVQDEQQQA
jgi:histone H3/H4